MQKWHFHFEQWDNKHNVLTACPHGGEMRQNQSRPITPLGENGRLRCVLLVVYFSNIIVVYFSIIIYNEALRQPFITKQARLYSNQ